jgi:hypothetical protein
MRRTLLLLIAGLALLASAISPVRAQLPGQIIVAPPPESADQKEVPLDSAFRERLVEPGQLRATGDLKDKLQTLPAFFGDTAFTFKPRTYYFDQVDPSGKVEEAWALGGSLEYKSGLAWDRIWLGAEFFGSWPLYTGPNAGETLLLSPSGSSYTVLGQAYVAANLSEANQVIAGDFTSVDTPYANREFNRMTPNAFQGVLFNGSLADEQQRLHYLAGYLDKIKERNSTEFVPMSQAAGSSASTGTAIVGLRYTRGEIAVGVAEYYTSQVSNIVYGGVTYTPRLSGSYEAKLSAQFTDQRSLAGASGTPLPNQWGLEAVGSRDFVVFTLSYTQTSSAGNLSSPWGDAPSFTRTEIHNTSRAGENAALAMLSYHFDRLDLPGVSVAAVGAYYWDAVSTASSPQPNQTEVDLYLDYKIPKVAPLDGLWFRVQRNWEWNAGGGQTTQWRAIVYWEIPLL